MRDDWGYTGIPFDDTSLPLLAKTRFLVAQDVAQADARWMSGFISRQEQQGLRQPGKLSRPPEVDIGALIDFGS